MSLRTRLDKLEPAVIASWRREWERLAQSVRDNTPEGVQGRLEQAFKEHRKDLADLQPQGATRDTDELLTALEDVTLDGLDVHALEAWFNMFDLPDPERPDLGFSPAALPAPPSEPPGVWEALEVVAPDPGKKGEAAAVVLYLLATARAVRECRP